MFEEATNKTLFDYEPLEPCFWDTPGAIHEDSVPLGVFYKAPFEIESPIYGFENKNLFEEGYDHLSDYEPSIEEPQTFYQSLSTTTEDLSQDRSFKVGTSKCAKLPIKAFAKSTKIASRKAYKKSTAKSTTHKKSKIFLVKKQLALPLKNKKLTKLIFQKKVKAAQEDYESSDEETDIEEEQPVATVSLLEVYEISLDELPQELPLIDVQSKSVDRISSFPSSFSSKIFYKKREVKESGNLDTSYYLSDQLIKEAQVALPSQTVNLVDSLAMDLESKDQNQEGAIAANGFQMAIQAILGLRLEL